MGDPTGLIARWNLDGVTWGRNTDPDGTIYLSLAQPERHRVQRLAVSGRADPAGRLRPAAPCRLPASRPASASPGTSGLSGTIEISAATASQAISLGAVPELTAWQLQTLRADWLAEDHPADTYTAGTTVSSAGGTARRAGHPGRAAARHHLQRRGKACSSAPG